ncbi:DNA polymerase III subunit alpha [Candidatus Daviesbacteria bacterium RIFCSPHIGHO2_12_FULL_37_11]|uniref:DNA polymerase III subunit alpha n=1 Tax=Candidatus Daviesbacteria bacterium RIFCSPHIGHO2_12_FULL_37_11 TaxID=1797777 RepID=A0A1F5KEM6_9BACT|nr:MAG: DNA polymerase III subunit alpha [Candidatus Daviesbacteria bacterium GWA1_38_6]OGE18155.1 MAG: DNA polymerase III subunit alpha [Candidatus Daviesbacteria bacterium RIFCSPHIGHO2_01_FULL_37_27]OGE39235.1 MAG: DNA polymerase III subunit alpha [Candidatus Daviesbacteria bacterium RIFCSPHIGHO2_12_FULL_37_11]OGE45647.1 MAG: DNA polymerase III subunit alpha [Candidatus Daviesbacteria bacterium RIFCSPLOWO2_01_FULL_37_10]
MTKFVHLHTHSEYSLLDGLSKITKLVKAAKDLGMDSLAITDHGVMYGAIEFYKECKSQNIKSIIGVEVYVAPRSHKSKEGKMDSEPYHLTLLAKNYQGYLNLLKLVSISHLEGFYYRPRVDKALLKQFHEGLIALSGCPAGEFIRTLDSKGNEKAEEIVKQYLDIFGEGNYYLEIQNHFYKNIMETGKNLDQGVKKDLENMARLQDLTWEAAKTIGKKTGIGIVATNDSHYIKENDAEAQDALLCIQTAKFISDVDRLRMIDTPNLYLKSSEEMGEAFYLIPEALENTAKIAEMVDLEIETGRAIFPVFKTPEDKQPMEFLKELTFEKAKEKMELSDNVVNRLNYELDIIEYKKYADYFLVVADFIDWSHRNGIITNTRGSAAGSLVLYSLGVTNLNPIDYLLPFERFLTKDRPTMPDIDVDLADDRRDDVIRYLMSKYGEDKVAHIVTFGTMMGRAAIRDIGRVMAIPYGEVDRIAKLVPPPHQGFHKLLKDAIKEVPELAELYRNNEQYKKMLELAIKVESTVRHASVHAAGILITPEDITKYVPLQREANGDKLVSQYDMFSTVDEYGGIGLVKMDLLGIRNLSILGRSVEFVKANQGKDVNIEKLPLDDKKTYDLLSRGETMGVFQLSSDGMKRYLIDLKPNNIFDIMAMVALYRPGPMSVIPEYIDRKHEPDKVTYLDPRMKEYMDQSLGLLVYQEDVILTAINIAGYSWTEADKFRKAMGKKKPEEMAKQKDHFVEGCVENGMKREKAEELFKLIETFAAYGFNKPHAASYAMTAYQTAYMKANFPVEFMAAVMTAESGDTEKIAHAIEECKRLEIVVLPPDINHSDLGFTIQDLKGLSKTDLERGITEVDAKLRQGIRFGLSAIKNVGDLAINSTINARKKGGEFKSIMDLCSRVDTRLVNKKALESLIKAGALDTLGSRAAQLIILDQCLEQSHKLTKSRNSGQVSLFGGEDESISVKIPAVDELPLEQMLIFEREFLGFYLHEPPYLLKLTALGEYVSYKISELSDELIGQKLTLGGVILDVKKVLTKKSQAEMAFVKISDGIGEIECVIFPQTFGQTKEFLFKDNVILVWGRIDKREDSLSLVVDNTSLFEPENAQKMEKNVEISVPPGTGADILQKINQTLRGYPGDTSVSILLPNGGDIPKRMILPFSVDPAEALESQIKELLGEGAFRRV